MAEYGVRLGLAGGLRTGIGFALDLEHKGWATAACLMVMRPTPEMTRLRGVGRAVSASASGSRRDGDCGSNSDPARRGEPRAARRDRSCLRLTNFGPHVRLKMTRPLGMVFIWYLGLWA